MNTLAMAGYASIIFAEVEFADIRHTLCPDGVELYFNDGELTLKLTEKGLEKLITTATTARDNYSEKPNAAI
ncbi:hypothetical protein [Actinokineospora terrae]|uniref:Uncharacterized protein n=1 Tax=Actinokineospora terrae TaxID=155974 RepID=A0A1H9XL33_9PSEU|nr:hypothetical protein [Actinokineospora terrae]SES46875.1 hypothetical protein SAMN04487818_116140 [Actinokineospora terrae]